MPPNEILAVAIVSGRRWNFGDAACSTLEVNPAASQARLSRDFTHEDAVIDLQFPVVRTAPPAARFCGAAAVGRDGASKKRTNFPQNGHTHGVTFGYTSARGAEPKSRRVADSLFIFELDLQMNV
uniref:Uncharacterized protein n=1 Tax=Romanomermis culicivorax TaxID=13658 RepID=A0A915JLI9_ROMCU